MPYTDILAAMKGEGHPLVCYARSVGANEIVIRLDRVTFSRGEGFEHNPDSKSTPEIWRLRKQFAKHLRD